MINATKESLLVTLERLGEPFPVLKNESFQLATNYIYMVKNGTVQIEIGGFSTIVASGEIIGEGTSSVIAIADSRILKVPVSVLPPNLHVTLLTKMVDQLSMITKKAATNQAETKKSLKTFEMFVVSLLFVISLYTLSLIPLQSFVDFFGVSTFVDVGLLLFFALLVFVIMKKSTFPLATFGISLSHWKRHLREATFLTLPILVFFLVLKWGLITFVPSFEEVPLFNLRAAFEGINFTYQTFLITVIIYVIFSFVQEFIARGGLQTAFYQFMPYSRGNKLLAILLSNIIFAMAHTHMGTIFALVAFVPGLFWGWLYARQQSLVGVSFSHVLIGIWVLFILGYPQLLS